MANDRRLATATAARQLDNVERADALALAVEREVIRYGRRLNRWLRTDPGIEEVQPTVFRETEQLQTNLLDLLLAGLRREAHIAYETALRMWIDGLDPEDWDGFLEDRAVMRGELPEAQLPDFPSWPGRVPSAGDVRRYIKQATVKVPRGPSLTAGLTVFPPPSVGRIDQIVFSTYGREWKDGLRWNQRIARLSRLAPPAEVADSLISGIAASEAPAKLSRRLRPLLQNNRASAMRVARTESLRVAETIQRDQYLSVDAVIGAQILSILGETTRPEHAARHGTIYFKPGGGSPTTAEMPVLPDEPNCLCWSSPVFNEPDVTQKVAGPEFDPVSMQRTFRTWNDSQRKRFIGSRRFRAVEKKLEGKRPPDFSDFINQLGKLLPTKQLELEELWRLELRSSLARDMIARLAKDVEAARASAVSQGSGF